MFYSIVYRGTVRTVKGTSAASPTFASIISMVNDARINAGKPVLGFLNPWLYSEGYTALNDITTGNNPGCGTEGFNVSALLLRLFFSQLSCFKTSIGWDPGKTCRECLDSGRLTFGSLQLQVLGRPISRS